MIIFVDNELEAAYGRSWGERIMAARLRIKYRLEDISGEPCLIVRYTHITPEFVRRYDARAIFISGNSANADEYDPAAQAGLYAVITSRAWPMFGFCGGHQVMAAALGAPLQPIGPLPAGITDPYPDFAPGMQKELGYLPVTITRAHPLLAGLGREPVMRQAHSWEITQPPPGFGVYGETAVSPVQIIIHDTLPIIGTQFHPEYFTDEHPAGRVLIENFWQYITHPA